jgi:signal transduction histidine kinase
MLAKFLLAQALPELSAKESFMAEAPRRLPDLWWGLDPADRWLAALRAMALLGGAVWGMVHAWEYPFDHEAHRQVFWLFATFAAYSALLYVTNALHPGRLSLLYRIAMVLDLAFIFILVRITGGMTSSFYLAFYVVIALHAFYFGLATGVMAALLAGLLYPFTDGWPPPIGLSDLGLRVGFFLLVGLCMGGVAERERRERRLVGQLNKELQDKQARLAEAQEQLIRSDRLATVGELAAGLAHDLRNPLAGVSGALHVLAGQLPGDDPQQALLTEIQSQVARMNKTLTELLRHARPPTPQYLPLNVNEVVEQTLWFLPLASGSGIEVVKRLQPGLPPLRLDPSLLHQALLNILVNARQAMPNGGQLTVGTRLRQNLLSKGEVVEVAIADTGLGILEENLSRIFQPFFTTKALGTGLGLAIAARIVEQHGGRIAVESEVGRGTTFRIVLPVPAQDLVSTHDDAFATRERDDRDRTSSSREQPSAKTSPGSMP